SGVVDKEAVDTKDTFSTGDKAWLWLKLTPNGEPTLRIRWSVNGNPVWTMDAVPVKLGRTWYYKTLDVPGTWKAEILDPSDAVVKEHSFTVTGSPTGGGAPAAAPAPVKADAAAAPAAEPAAGDGGASAHVEVVDLKLAT